MTNDLDFDLYANAITRLNVGFSKTGKLIQNNARFLAHGMHKEDVEYAISRIIPDFEESYEDINKFYKELFKCLNDENTDIEEFKPFLEHAVESFPKYLEDLNQTVANVSELKINTDELLVNIGKIIKVFEYILILSQKTLNEYK